MANGHDQRTLPELAAARLAASLIVKLPVFGPAVVSGLTAVTIETSFQMVAAEARAIGLVDRNGGHLKLQWCCAARPRGRSPGWW